MSAAAPDPEKSCRPGHHSVEHGAASAIPRRHPAQCGLAHGKGCHGQAGGRKIAVKRLEEDNVGDRQRHAVVPKIRDAMAGAIQN